MSSVGAAKVVSIATLGTRLRVLTTKPALVAGFMALVLYLATPFQVLAIAVHTLIGCRFCRFELEHQANLVISDTKRASNPA